MLDTYNKELAICQAERADCYDLAAALPHDSEYFFDHIHFSEKGSALAASKVADFLRHDEPP